MNSTRIYVSGIDVYAPNLLDHAHFYRSLALSIDKNPKNIEQYATHPIIIKNMYYPNSCVERTKQFEALSYGDVGVLLASPGASLSGLLIKELGDLEQQKKFFNYLDKNKCRTFLAVTEPMRGSDAANLKAKLSCFENKFYLSGEKCFVGNGAVGDMGVIIARTSEKLLGMAAILIYPGQIIFSNTLSRSIIPTTGLRGASLSYLSFNHYFVNENQILGQHLRFCDRGLMGIIKTFNRMRTCVGALAIGLTQAFLDYTFDLCFPKNHKVLINLSLELNCIRENLYKAASRIDEDITDSAAASLAKVNATRFSEKIINHVVSLLEPDFFWEHPLLEKWYRDLFGFEYMEGTMQVHYKNVANNYFLTKRFL